jgi:hypothetical protein
MKMEPIDQRIVNRVISEVAGTIQTNGIWELSRMGAVSSFTYVSNCIIATAYNALRDRNDMSYGEFHDLVWKQINRRIPAVQAG